jgi:esterase/lipase superfamily enzyme
MTRRILSFLRLGPASHDPSRCALILSLAAFALAGCSTAYSIMPTPLLYTGPQAMTLFTNAHADVRTPPLDLLFVTDRAPAASAEAPEPYTAERSRSRAFGSTTILFGEGVTWDTVVRLSTERTDTLTLKLGPTKELGRFPPIPFGIVETAGGVMRAPEVIEAHEIASRALQAEVQRRLASSARKEVVLFVHGYANSFSDAAMTMGELCHFLGREFVCGIFTWPAGGKSGILFGYDVDYESSEYAAEHLRKTIRAIATTPGVERIHLLAHSRGTDILATAMSDLTYEAFTQQSHVARRYKIGNIVLIAPDIDADVAIAKIFKAVSDPDLPYGPAPNPRMVFERIPGFQITLYVSPNDRALAASSWLFGSIGRLGKLDAGRLTPEQIEYARRVGFIDVIQVRDTSGWIGHSYFTADQRVSADLIAVLRYGLRPNDPGRPLEEIKRPFWRVPAQREAGGSK